MSRTRLIAAAAAVLLWSGQFASAADRVTFERNGENATLTGKIVVTAQDGGLMLMTPDGVLWNITPDELKDCRADEQPFTPLNGDGLKRQLLAELPAGFDAHETAHYLIFYNTSQAYAQWCGALFERLYAAFTNYWGRRGMELREPRSPLVVYVFADKRAYADFSTAELGSGAGSIVGYYSLRTNRVTMHDLTGVERAAANANLRTNAAQINRVLARPEAAAMVATIVHEATHQIAYNCGLHARFADIPLWVSEGMAVYFETPDLNSGKGWRTIGAVNRSRLIPFNAYLRSRPADSLKTLIADDSRFRDPQQAADAYAEAWALNYFLIRQHAKQYQAYLKRLAEKGPLVWDEPAERIKHFTEHFGDIEELDAEFLRYMARVR